MRAKVQKFFRSGSSEVLGFVCMAPLIIMLLGFILSAAQISCVNQAMEAAAYSAGRVAIVTDDYDAAKENAQQVAEDIIIDSAGNIDPNSVNVNLEIIQAGGGENEWVKGNLCKVSVIADVKTILPFYSGTRGRNITFMIERPAPNAIDLDGLI